MGFITIKLSFGKIFLDFSKHVQSTSKSLFLDRWLEGSYGHPYFPYGGWLDGVKGREVRNWRYLKSFHHMEMLAHLRRWTFSLTTSYFRKDFQSW